MTDLQWDTIDTDNLGVTLGALYADYRAKAKQASEARAKFEAAATEQLKDDTPKGKAPVFGYKFGKLSMAWGDAKAAPSRKPASGIGALFG